MRQNQIEEGRCYEKRNDKDEKGSEPCVGFVIMCRIHYTDGTMKVFATDASEFQWEGCYFNAGAEVASAKLFVLDKTTLRPLAAEVSWN